MKKMCKYWKKQKEIDNYKSVNCKTKLKIENPHEEYQRY